MQEYTSFTVQNRGDGLPRLWRLLLQSDYENSEELRDIARELIEIPVEPLPDPLVSGNDEWQRSMSISGYEFMDAWTAYLEFLRDYGTICHSEFKDLRLSRDTQSRPPRGQCAAVIDVKLHTGDWENQMYVVALIYATGCVDCYGMDEDYYQEFSY